MPGDDPRDNRRHVGIGPAALRKAMSAFATGVAIVTTEYGGQPHGMTVNSLTSLSLDPPLLLVCLIKDAYTTQAVTGRKAFAVNILSHTQQHLAGRFAQRGQAHFNGVAIELNPMGLPCLPQSLARLDCTVETTWPGGDHTIIIGRIHGYETHDGIPLIFYQDQYMV